MVTFRNRSHVNEIDEMMVRDALARTTDGSSFPLNNLPDARQNQIVRIWTDSIPVQINGLEKGRAAINKIKEKTGIALEVVPDGKSIERGLIFSRNTSMTKNTMGMNAEARKGTVSGGPDEGAWPRAFVNSLGVISARLYINIGNEKYEADTIGEDIYIHEVAHALGMFAHFDGFGGQSSSAFGQLAWLVLKTLYANSPGTKIADAHILLK